jgi:hypothetical protein
LSIFFQILERDLRMRCDQLSGLARDCNQLAVGDGEEAAAGGGGLTAYARVMSGQLDRLHGVMAEAQSGLACRLDSLQVRRSASDRMLPTAT